MGTAPRRVVVTGLGAVTPVGNDVPSTWAALVAGRSGIGPITLFDASPFPIRIAGEVKGFDPVGVIEAKQLRHLDRCTQLALVATFEAVRDAKLVIDATNCWDVGIVFGSAIGGVGTILVQQQVLQERGPGRVSPFFLANIAADTASGQIAIALGARGHNLAVVSACATGGHAIGEAGEVIRRGDAEVVIAGGADACVLPLAIAGFSVMRALAREKESPERSCRPFASDRDGFVLAEGAAALVLESLEHAQKRGATIYGELVGYGSSADAYHMVSPDEAGDGAVRAMECALKKADLTSEQVDYINAHGTGTPVNDRAETLAIKRVFGEHTGRIMVSSTKSMTGHMMGASGAVEAIVCLLTIRNSIVPPTINLDHPDPECDLDYVPHQARNARVEVALSNAMGLGGHNSCVIFRRFPS